MVPVGVTTTQARSARPEPRARPALRARWAPITAAAFMAAYAAAFAWLSVRRHEAFGTGRFDLGNMVQAIWSTAHGRPLESTEVAGEQFSRLGAHVDPILVLFAPVFWFTTSPEALLVLQALIVASGALPMFWLGRRWLGDERLAVGAAAVYLLYPPLQFATLFDFHPVTLAAPLLMFAIWAAEEERIGTFVLVGALAALTQEQVGLAVGALCVWLALRHPRQRRRAAVIGAAAAAWSIVATAVIIPLFSVTGGNQQVRRYGDLGGSLGDLALALLTQPWRVAEVLATPGRVLYLLALTVPVLALSLLAPALAAGALPQLAINLLAGDGPPQSIQFHYAAVVAPFLLASAVLGLARLRAGRLPGPLRGLARGGRLALPGLVAATALSGVWLGPLPIWGGVPAGYDGSPYHRFTIDAHARAMAEAVGRIPDGARVSASNAPGGHLSARRRVHLFPEVGDAQWILLDTRRPTETDRARKTLRPVDHAAGIALVARSPDWQLVYEGPGVELLRRTGVIAGEPDDRPSS